MLAVTLNQPMFEYDIHSIVKAFYPAETVKVFEQGTKEFISDGSSPAISIAFYEDRIEVILGGNRECAELTEPGNRAAVKNDLKKLLYRMLTEHTGKQLPWGTLTGIRPTKIAMQLLEEGKSR